MIPLRDKKELLMYNKIPVFIEDKPVFDAKRTISAVEKRVPDFLVSELDYILITDSTYLKERDLDSVYLDGVIYLSSEVQDGEEAALTLAHEIAHSVEELFPQIYQDESIEAEFLGKRRKLYEILSSMGIENTGQDFLNAEYCEKFDDFLYLEIGYPLLRSLTSGLFMSPYAVTSVREYFADAFEEYFFRDPATVKLISPSVYFKIEDLLDNLGEKHV
tara:strand:+ start:4158 stop:4811 length:654 start_codon:yes stop_codon:yes gene_type:complete